MKKLKRTFLRRIVLIVSLVLICSFAQAQTFVVQPQTQTSIEEALVEATQDGGGVVVIPLGRYVLTSEIRIKCDNLTIIGTGALLYTDFEDPRNMGLVLTGKNIKVRDVSFEANPIFKRPLSGGYLLTLLDCTDFRIEDCNFLNSPSGGIWVGRGSSDGIISGNSIKTDDRKDIYDSADGIQCSGGSHDILITENILTRTGDDAISIGTYYWDEDKTHDILITGNIIRGSRCHGVIATRSDNIDIIGNTISDCRLAGIAAYNYGNNQHAPCENIVIKGNVLRGNGCGESTFNRGRHCSIWIDQVGTVTLDGNLISGNPVFVYDCDNLIGE